jgi:hypothetical protein
MTSPYVLREQWVEIWESNHERRQIVSHLSLHPENTKNIYSKNFQNETFREDNRATLTPVFWKLTHTQRVEVQSELLLSVNAVFE